LEAVIFTRPKFDRAYRSLPVQQQAAVKAAIARMEPAFGRPHLHSGIGLRPFGKYFEFRAGLELRVLFLAEGGDLHLCFVGNHDQVRAFIKNQ
jgi:hypothetical protein